MHSIKIVCDVERDEISYLLADYSLHLFEVRKSKVFRLMYYFSCPYLQYLGHKLTNI